MGQTVYDSEIAISEGAHVFAHSRKDGQEGIAYLVINNSLKKSTVVELPKNAMKYTIDGNGYMRNRNAYLNGKLLELGEGDTVPELEGVEVEGSIELAPGSCTFLII